jgi:hypothetical protein
LRLAGSGAAAAFLAAERVSPSGLGYYKTFPRCRSDPEIGLLTVNGLPDAGQYHRVTSFGVQARTSSIATPGVKRSRRPVGPTSGFPALADSAAQIARFLAHAVMPTMIGRFREKPPRRDDRPDRQVPLPDACRISLPSRLTAARERNAEGAVSAESPRYSAVPAAQLQFEGSVIAPAP